MDRRPSPSPIDTGRAALRQGVAHFNRGEYFEAHEALERPWRRLAGPDRDLYQGLIKVAAAFHHASRGKWRGAVLLLRRGIEQLRPHVERREPLRLDVFLTEVESCLSDLRRCDEGEGEFDLDRVPRLPDVVA